MTSEVRVPIESDRDIVTARRKGRELAATLGFTSTDQALIATAISEIVRNMVTFAGKGTVFLSRVEDGSCRGLRVVAEDHGPGIDDPEAAMRDGYSSAHGLGLGLPGAKRIMDTFDLDSTAGVGTTVTMTRWLR